MAIYVSTACLSDNKNVVQVVEQYLLAGIINIELGSTHEYGVDQISALREKKANFIVHNYFPPPKEEIVLNLASQDKEILQKSKRQVKRSIEFCVEMGIKFYSFHPGFLVDPVKGEQTKDKRDYDFNFSERVVADYDQAFFVFMESIKEIVAYAQERGINIACENAGSIDKNKFLMMSKVEEFERMFDQIRSKNFGILLDLGHLNLAANANNFNKFDFIDRLSSKVMAFHIHDNDGIKDEHRCLCEDSWALKIVKREKFRKIPVVFEGRDLSIKKTLVNRNLISGVMSNE